MARNDPPHPKHHRRLREDEIALWREVAARVIPRPGSLLPDLAVPSDKLAKGPKPPPKASPAPITRPATAAPYFPPRAPPKNVQMPSANALAPMERRLKKRLLRGQTGIDATIDLHGMVQAQAHSALRQFIHAAFGRGDRLVLVVTGKGLSKSHAMADLGDDFHGVGVLRRVVPHWLRAPDLLPMIVSLEQAGQPHGGSGALIVHLRRRARMEWDDT
ncbi:MAG: Smr/MutS family protein [Hyphomicrobiales bacterium]|nr:Smr/MutS family protein [Hyphomicrobiales bacterium]MDE2114134.1 Smr/MutS family protein [Hyphomicrobiales bacterium]